MRKLSVIIIDGDLVSREALKTMLLNEGFDVQAISEGSYALEQFKKNIYDIAILDIKLPDCSGIDILCEIKSQYHKVPVLIITACHTVNIAVDAMQRGAFDFIPKPFSKESILLSINKAINDKNNKPEEIPKQIKQTFMAKPHQIITNNQEMIRLLKQAESIAKSNASVLIQGESGTGKELLATYIVQNSGREKQPYITMNCAALPDTLAESELFGYEKGAFTGAFQRRIGKFEQAHRGTLLLDEISELSLALQAKLLRIIQEKKVDRLGGGRPIDIDVRMISTCNIDLKQAVKKGLFREDLFFRINVIPMTIPSLRNRRDDIPMLANFFITKHSQFNQRLVNDISSDALDCLRSHEWSGNVRELENVIERAVLISDQQTIQPEHLMIENISCGKNNNIDFVLGTSVKEMEKQLILKTLQHVNANRTHAAQLLGISIRTLRNKLREYRSGNLSENPSMMDR